jgi:hypothetical protein
MKRRISGIIRTWRVVFRQWKALLVLTVLICLLCFQAFAYYDRLDLSLGPRVILEPWLIQNGFVLYENIADLHAPLMPLFIALIKPLVPDGLLLAKLLLVLLISVITLLIFLAVRRLGGWLVGLWAAWFFVMLSPVFNFGKLWYETFLAPLYILLLLFYDASDSRRSFKSLIALGLVAGIALLVKQHSGVVVVALLAWTTVSNHYLGRSKSENFRELALLGSGVMLPVAAFTVYQVIRAGSLKGFLYWTIGYSLTSDYGFLAAQWPTGNQVLTVVSGLLFLGGAFFFMVELKRRGDIDWLYFGWGFVLFVASGLTVYPRFEYFHLQSAIPAAVWLSALALFHAFRSRGAGRPFMKGTVLALSLLWLIRGGAAYRTVFRTNQVPRQVMEYSRLEPLANQLKRHIGPSASMYVFPDNEATANLYYLMRCLPPRFWVFTYPWNMTGTIKRKILSTIKNPPPEWIVYYMNGHRTMKHYAPEIVKYIFANYRRVTKLRGKFGVVLLLRHLKPA